MLSEVSVFPKGDLLINLIDNKCVPYFDSVAINSKLQKILNEARNLEKKTGVACLCRSFGTFTTTLRNESIVIPIFLQHVEANIHKNSNTVQFSTHGEKELNPYLKKHFNDSSHGNEIRDLIEFQHRYGLTKSSRPLPLTLPLIFRFWKPTKPFVIIFYSTPKALYQEAMAIDLTGRYCGTIPRQNLFF